MDVHLRLDADADGPVVVKSAAPEALGRLRGEAARLARAVHPGVVAVVLPPGGAAPDQDELRTRYAGEPVSVWAGTLASIAGLGAAVASTLADLHEIGIVHGRIDASHVLIGGDARPRLCGLAPPSEAATPADDVAALAQVLAALATRGEDERSTRRSARAAATGAGSSTGAWGNLGGRGSRGDHGSGGTRSGHGGDSRVRRRWPRRAAVERRAFALALDHALDPVPTRRPTARVFAAALLAAVPDAQLPPPGPDRSRSAIADARVPAPPDEPAPPDRASPAPARSPHAPTDPPTHTGAEPPQPNARSSHAPNHPPTHTGDEPLDTEPSRPGSLAPAPPPGPAPAGPTSSLRHLAVVDDATSPAAAPDRPPLAASAANAWPVGDDGDVLTRESPFRPGRRGGEQQPSRAGGRGDPRWRRIAWAGTGAVLLVAAVAVGVVVAAFAGSGDDAAVSRPGTPAPRAAPCPAAPSAAAPAADVDGDGCPEHLVVAGGTVTVGNARWSLGEPGDVVAVGDWDCRGGATPAVLRPATGDVFVFASWAAPGKPLTVHPDQRVPGAVGVRAEAAAGGCDALRVDLSSGASTTVAVRR